MHLVQEIGSYAGFAAVVGLAVLSALYFSQARDVRRLREWAGRAPERAAEEEARVTAAAQAQSQAQQRAAAAAAAGGATVVRPPQPQPQGSAAAAANPPPSGVPAPPPPTLPSARPTPAAAGAGVGAPSTPILAGMRPREPWYRRIHLAPRYIALIVVGILVIGAGAAYGISQLSSNDNGSPSAAVTHNSSGKSKGSSSSKKSHKAAPLNKGSITVAVLNGTTVTGLAATTATKIEQAGFKRGTTDNALTQGQQAESVVEYAKGNERAAQAVGKELGITQFEPIDPETQRRAGDATVAVIIGADLAGGGSSG